MKKVTKKIAIKDEVERGRYVTRIACATSSQFGYLCGDYAYRKLGWKKAVYRKASSVQST